jgi:hypothetical protein
MKRSKKTGRLEQGRHLLRTPGLRTVTLNTTGNRTPFGLNPGNQETTAGVLGEVYSFKKVNTFFKKILPAKWG